MKHSLSENIKQLRQLNGLNQVEFAKEICVTKQCVSNWENDNVLPSIEMLIRLADFFNVSTDYLLGRSTDSTILVNGLTEEQQTHIRFLVKDFLKLNQESMNKQC